MRFILAEVSWLRGFKVEKVLYRRAISALGPVVFYSICFQSAQAQTFTYTGSIQTWTVTAPGRYRVTAIGAQGASAEAVRQGGRGASVTGDFTFHNGELYQIAVGGAGAISPSNCNGGGGGGTFFVSSSNAPLLIAGGGGGTRATANQNGTDASITPYGTTASGAAQTYIPAVKSTDLGLGGIVSSDSWGSGGAGFFGDGAIDPYNAGALSPGGRSWANGMLGGSGIGSGSNSAPGGFGGGGAGNGSCGGGGGGGYSGGDGGRVAGGGGSWNTGANPVAIAGVGVGDGELIIQLLQLLYLRSLLPSYASVNQRNVASAIDAFTNGGGTLSPGFLALFDLKPDQLAAALTQRSGETATGVQQTTINAMTQFMGLLDRYSSGNMPTSGPGASHFADEGDVSAYATSGRKRSGAERDAYGMITKAPLLNLYEPHWSVWAAGYGGSQTTDGNAVLGSNSTNSRVYGTAAGADYLFSPNTIAGFALAGGGTNFSVANGGTGSSDLFQAGAFVRHTVGPAYISAALAYGWQDVTTNRTVTGIGIDQLQARFNVNAISGRVEGGYRYETPWMGLTPYAAAQFINFNLPAYAEQAVLGNNTFALNYNSKSVTATRSELGLRSDKSFTLTDSMLTLRGRFAWAHDYNSDRNIGATFQTLPGASFIVNGAVQAKDTALVTASAEVKWRNGFSLAGTFEGEFSSVTTSYAGRGVVRYQW